jgi:general secretion pathway protein G
LHEVVRLNTASNGPARRRHAGKAGYSLLEILIVLTIIALIAALVGPRLFAQLDRSKVTTARVQARGLETALETMRVDINRYPTQQEGLALLMQADPKTVTGWAGPYLGGALPNDPWGKPYVYEPPKSDTQPPAVISYGADGKPGGSGNSADVRNAAGT